MSSAETFAGSSAWTMTGDVQGMNIAAQNHISRRNDNRLNGGMGEISEGGF
jgi:hypothetical protein